MIRALILVAMACLVCAPAGGAPRRYRTVCVIYHDPGAGPVRICGLPIRRR
jgi:hypothetical protein